MVNQQTGRVIAFAAAAAIQARGADTALDILDRICDGHEGREVEFETENPDDPFANFTDPHPEAPLGMLLLEAFAPEGVAARDRYAPMMGQGDEDATQAATDAWFSEVYEPFCERYGFN